MLRALLIAFLVVTSSASAQDISDSHRNAAEALLQSLDMESLLNQSIQVSLDIQLEQQPEIAPYRDIMEAFFEKHMSWSSLKPALIQIYAESFTEDELDDITAFYRTPTGQKAARLTPVLMEQGMLLGQRAVQENLPELEQAVMNRALILGD